MAVRLDRGLTKSSGRDGATWQKLRALVFANKGDVCGICGHPGSTDVDHIIARSVRPDLAEDLDNLQPAHGATGRCHLCDPEEGRNCNREKATSGMEYQLVTTEDWFGE